MINKLKEKFLSTIEKLKNNEHQRGMEALYYSSYLFLIVSIYGLYNKLYLSSILTFYLFITSIVHWRDYNNKFKLCADYYMVFIMVFYSIYTCFKINNYTCIVSLILLVILYIISYYYTFQHNYLIASNLWIIAHCMVAITCIYMFNKLSNYDKK